MKILILSQWYYPEPAQLIQELAETLKSFGHQISVLTGYPNYPSGKLYPNYKMKLKMDEVINGIPVTRIPLYTDHSRSGLKRIINYLSFCMSASILGLFLSKKPDIIFVYHPPLTIGLPAIILGKFWNVPFVYQIQDMWPETLSATGMIKNKKIIKFVGTLANKIYNAASSLCVISPGFKDNLISKNIPAQKINVISNWIDIELCTPQPPDIAIKEKLGLQNKFNIMYAGNIGEAQGIETILDAAQILSYEKKIQFVIVGDGTALPGIRLKFEKMRLDNVKFLGRFEVKEMAKYYALSDVLLVHLIDNPLFRITIPSKIYTYLASGKPILAALHGDAASLIEESQAGLVCIPQNAQAMADLAIRFFTMKEDDRNAIGMRGRNFVEKNFKREYLVEKIDGVLKQAAHDWINRK